MEYENKKYHYALNATESRKVKLLGLAGLVSVVFLSIGFFKYITISPIIAIVFGPVLVLTVLRQIIHYGLMTSFKGFSVRNHKMKVNSYWGGQRASVPPKVAVAIPAAGEAMRVVKDTVIAALSMNYPNFNVYLLDDTANGKYEGFAHYIKTPKFNYIRRPNTGHQKKAGNLNHAMDVRLKHYDYVLVLDADFQPRPEMLREMVPYAGNDVGIVQTPQHFPMNSDVHKRSKLEYGAAYIQEDFYRVVQVARDKFGAAICVGTNALYNVKAIQRVGGYEGVGSPHGWAHSEDVNTGLKVINSYNDEGDRYRIKYIPIQLATGTCPDTHHSFYKQQNRWCTGSVQLWFSRKTLFSEHLTLTQKICYFSNTLYYFWTMTLLISPLYLLALALLDIPGNWHYTLFFLPMLFTDLVITKLVLRKKFRPLSTAIVVMSNAYTYIQALFLLLIRRPLGWEATGASRSKRSHHFLAFKLIAGGYFFAVYLLTMMVVIINDMVSWGPSIFIIAIFFFSLASHLAFLFYTLTSEIEKGKHHKNVRLYAGFVVMFAVMVSGMIGVKYKDSFDLKYDRQVSISLIREAIDKRETEKLIGAAD